MNDVMVDIETLSTGTRAAIVSIGAVKFDIESGELGPEFYKRVRLKSALNCGLQFDADTIEWWLQQGDAARLELVKPGVSLITALQKFGEFVGEGDVLVWANGSMFDNRILFDAYELMGLQLPWHYRDDRDQRTLTDIARRLGVVPEPVEFEGEEHKALNDAKHQARQVVALFRALYENGLVEP